MSTDDHQPFNRPKTSSSTPTDGADAASLPSSSSKDKKKKMKKRISRSMSTDDHQPFNRPETSSTPTPTLSTDWLRWGELPNDILSLILQKLILQDHLRLSCVCVPWSLAVRGGGLGYRPSPIPQLPWLMIPGAGRDRTSAKFISLSEHRTYDIPLPHPPIRKRLCVGSSHGWLITLFKLSEMHLLNPITGIQIPLPAITTTVTSATTYPSGYRRIGSRPRLDAFFGKAILSSAPNRDGTGDFTIFLIRSMRMSSYRTLAIARIGDDAWTTFEDENIFDIMYHKGQLLIQGVDGLILAWEQQQHDHRLSFVPRLTIDARAFRHNSIPCVFAYHNDILDGRKHLVQSMTGELFMLIRTGQRTREEETRFKIVRLDLDRNEYVPVDDLKDLVFFVGINDSIVVSATKFPEVKRNCVYFTKHCFVKRKRMKNIPSRSPPNNTGVFDVETESSAELLDNIGPHLSMVEKKHIGSLMDWPPTTWITPTLF